MNELALAYAETKLKEYLLSKRKVIGVGYTNFDNDELQYLKSAYDYAVANLTE